MLVGDYWIRKVRREIVAMKRLLRGWVRWILILVLLLVGMALFFHQTISHIMMTYTTDRYQVSNVSRENIEQNETASITTNIENKSVKLIQHVVAIFVIFLLSANLSKQKIILIAINPIFSKLY